MRSNKVSLGGRKTFMMFLILLKPDVLLFGCYCSVIYIYKFQLDFNTTYTSFQTDVCQSHSLLYLTLNIMILTNLCIERLITNYNLIIRNMRSI